MLTKEIPSESPTEVATMLMDTGKLKVWTQGERYLLRCKINLLQEVMTTTSLLKQHFPDGDRCYKQTSRN